MLAFVLSEFVIFASSLFLMPRGTLGSAVFVDGARAIAAAALTAGSLPRGPADAAWLGIPICVFAFAGLSWVVGLVRRADIDLLAARGARPFRAVKRDADGTEPPPRR